VAAHLTSSVIQPSSEYVTDRRPFPFLMPLECAVTRSRRGADPPLADLLVLVAFVMFTGVGTAAFHPEVQPTACIGIETGTGMSLFSVGGTWVRIGGPRRSFS